MNKLPRRPPRVMTGLAAILAKAQDLSGISRPAPLDALPPARMPDRKVSDAEAQRDLNALVDRLLVAELQVARVCSVLGQVEDQLAKLKPDNPFRATTVSIVSALKVALEVPPR